MKVSSLIFGLAVVLLSGCATSFDRIAAEKRLNTVNLDKIQSADSTLKKPFKLGIFADLETVLHMKCQNFRWTGVAKIGYILYDDIHLV